ncbi:MAG: ABC-type transport auxiliary lipoprotein family protein [Roseobacter sp.]
MKSFVSYAAMLFLIAGCGAPSERYAVSSPDATQTHRIAFRAVEIRDVSLPSYAADDQIVLGATDGRLVNAGDVLWADTPERAISLSLSRHISKITGARVASNPWPFEALPDARLDLRFQTLLAGEDGQYHAKGLYFVAVGDGRRERSGLFDLTVAFDPVGGPAAIAQARGQVVLDLAAFLSRSALR